MASKLTYFSFLALPQNNQSFFNINLSKLIYTNTNGQWTQYIFNELIPPTASANFKIKITVTQNRHIRIGVVDYSKQKDQRTSHNSGNAMCYEGNTAYKYPSGSG